MTHFSDAPCWSAAVQRCERLRYEARNGCEDLGAVDIIPGHHERLSSARRPIKIVRCRIRDADDRMGQGLCAGSGRCNAADGADALDAWGPAEGPGPRS